MVDQACVRTAVPEDAAAISALLYCFNGEALQPEDLSRRMAEAEGLETVFLAELAPEPAGLLVLRIMPTLSDAYDWAEITELYVRPSARRRGIGSRLIDSALRYARERGSKEIHLLVDPENEVALAFYKALGFHRDSWEMSREI
jgi:ribosomal protein S18 acetylase RimI-like enzyme